MIDSLIYVFGVFSGLLMSLLIWFMTPLGGPETGAGSFGYKDVVAQARREIFRKMAKGFKINISGKGYMVIEENNHFEDFSDSEVDQAVIQIMNYEKLNS